MKLRILDDSIRLRLTRSEVEQIGQGAVVEGRTHFPGGGEFRYTLGSGDVETPSAAFEQGVIAVTLPRSQAEHWAGSDMVTIEARQPLAEASDLRLLIEKDFRCLAPRDDEDQSDAFEHPSGDTQTC